MCRIAGIAGREKQHESNLHAVKRMCDAMKHGGPDDEGIYVSEHKKVILGNRRLSLLDLSSAGKMPLVYQSRYVITYNGELYNYLSLKSSLIDLGHQFYTNTDTEVLVAAFAQWREGAFVKFSGMFAFAIWDMVEDELFLVRDSIGIKPLYYSIKDEQLFFASEVRAFNETGIHQESTKNWPVYFMAYGHLPEPITTHENVYPLPKGFFLKYSVITGKFSFQSYQHYSYSHLIDSRKNAIDTIRECMNESVKGHLLSDAPIGIFLSGGLDSGIIAALSKESKQELHTLSIYFDEEAFSEKKYQDQINQQLQAKQHQLLLKENIFHESFEQILHSMDLPSCDGINTWFISKYAKENGFKAVLSGLGGDELFGGYPSFNRIGISKGISMMPDFSKKIFKKSNHKRLNRLAYLQMDGVKGMYLFLRGHYTPFEIAQYLDCSESQVWEILEDSPVLPNVQQTLGSKNLASWLELNLYMQNQLLRDADVMSMIHGVEIRVPFLDKQVMQAALKMSDSVKYSGKFSKQLLIDAFGKLLPEGVWNRPKMGFSFPFADWLKQNSMVKQLKAESSIRFDHYHERFLQNKIHWSQMMTLVIMAKRKIKGIA